MLEGQARELQAGEPNMGRLLKMIMGDKIYQYL